MRTCKIDGCERSVYGWGWCKFHYQKWYRHGDPFYTGNERHGMTNSHEYHTWYTMKQRCYNSNNKDYHRYGGRGIAVCDRWKNSFLAFFADMGAKPFPKAQIDRIDNDGNYEPGNCRWATCTVNNRNSSHTKLTIEKAKEIRAIYKNCNISKKKLSLIYGVVEGTIGHIINRKTWNEVMKKRKAG